MTFRTSLPRVAGAMLVCAAALCALTLAFFTACTNTTENSQEDIASQPAEANQFAVMSTTDMHGKCWDQDIIKGESVKENYLSASTAVSKIREQFGERTVLFDNGDVYQGSDLSSLNMRLNAIEHADEINPCSVCLAEMKYDGMTLGNHEFNYNWDLMNQNYEFIKNAGVNVIAANIYNKNTGQRVLPAYMTKTINVDGNQIKIAIIGLENTDIPRWDSSTNYPNLIFHSPENTTGDLAYEVQKVQSEMKAAGVNPDFTILSMHSGLFKENAVFEEEQNYKEELEQELDDEMIYLKNTENQAYRVIRKTTGIDFVINGHDHVSWYSGRKIENSDGRKITIVNGATKDLTKTVFNVNKSADGKLSFELADTNNIKLANYESDASLKEQIKPYAEAAVEYVNGVVGQLDGGFEGDNTYQSTDYYLQQTDSIDLINRSQIWKCQTRLREKFGSVAKLNEYLAQVAPSKNKLTDNEIQVDFSISSNPIKVQAKDGEMRRKDIISLYKYDNTLYCIPVTGQQIKDLLEYNATYRYEVRTDSDGNKSLKTTGDVFTLPLTYGLNFTYDMTKPTNQRVTIGDFSNGKKFDLNATYLMAMNNYQLGNSINYELGKTKEDEAVYSQVKDDGPGWIVFNAIQDYVRYTTETYGATYNTDNCEQNDEHASHWAVIY